MIAVAAPPRVAARVAATTGPLRVLHRGPHALYLALGDDVTAGCVGVVSRRAAQVPCALRVPGDDLGALADVRSARVTDGTLVLDGVGLRVARIVSVAVPPLPPPTVPARLATDAAAALRRTGQDPVPGRATHLLAAGDPAAVPLLLGRGGGLTPLGDDVLCGWLAARHATGGQSPAVVGAVRARWATTTTLSAELLDCAARGEVLPEYAAWLAAALGGGESARARDALVSVGHTSGAGLLLGAVLALAPHALPHPLEERLTA